MATTPYPLPRETRETEVRVGDGGKTYGPFGFRIFDIADVRALVKPEGADAWTPAEATAAKVGGHALDHFTVTFAENLPATTRYVVQAARVHERETAVTKGGVLRADELEKELSKQGSVLEEMRRDVDRAWKAPFGSEADYIDAADIAGAQAAAETATAAAGAASGSATAASNAAGAAITAREKARDWATAAEDVPVDDGVNPAGNSAFHWYRKAWAIAQSISTGFAGLIHDAGSKATPVDADELALVDSADEWKLKKLTWANMKAALAGTFLPKAGGAMAGPIDLTKAAAPADPAAGLLRLYAKTDDKVAFRTSAGIEHVLGATGDLSKATQTQAESGTGTDPLAWSPERIRQGIVAEIGRSRPIYAGTEQNLTNYPVGHYVLHTYSGAPPRNSVTPLYYETGQVGRYSTIASGNVLLEGTWNIRGSRSPSGDPTGLSQRTA